MFYVI
ncbi:hypothetical protein Zm00014a_035847 [Zea mays]